MFSKELQDTSTSFDNFDMGILSKYNFKKFLVQNPISQAFRIYILGWFLFETHCNVEIRIEFASILRVIHQPLPLLLH